MIILNNKVRIILNIFCLTILFSACFEEETGCMDITAANFNAAADNACMEDDNSPASCPCTFNTLNMEVDFIFQDSLIFNRDTAFLNNLEDTLLLNEISLVFSEFGVINTDVETFSIEDRADFNNDGELDFLNDAVVSNLTGFDGVVGTMHFSEMIRAADFRLGLRDEINDATLNFEEAESLEALVDSMYVDQQDRLAFVRLEVSKIDGDTIDYSFNFFDPEQMIDLRFNFDTLIRYQDNVEIELEADIYNLFENVIIDGADAETQISNNFDRFMRQKM